MWTVNTYSGVARLDPRRVLVKRLREHRLPPKLFYYIILYHIILYYIIIYYNIFYYILLYCIYTNTHRLFEQPIVQASKNNSWETKNGKHTQLVTRNCVFVLVLRHSSFVLRPSSLVFVLPPSSLSSSSSFFFCVCCCFCCYFVSFLVKFCKQLEPVLWTVRRWLVSVVSWYRTEIKFGKQGFSISFRCFRILFEFWCCLSYLERQPMSGHVTRRMG